jgi:pyruvate,water dikinase
VTTFVVPLMDPAAGVGLVGGKGASLARLVREGLPVPPGFFVTTRAYHAFVEQSRLRAAILEAARDAPDNAARRISDLFEAHEMPDEVATAIRTA